MSSSIKIPPWAVKAHLKAFSVIIQSNDILPLFRFSTCWLSISSPASKSVTNLAAPNGKEITVLTVMEQIGCSEDNMIQSFGVQWVKSIANQIPFVWSQKFKLAKLVSISSVDFNETTETQTPNWSNIVTKAYQSCAWRRLLSLIVKLSDTTYAKLKACTKI